MPARRSWRVGRRLNACIQVDMRARYFRRPRRLSATAIAITATPDIRCRSRSSLVCCGTHTRPERRLGPAITAVAITGADAAVRSRTTTDHQLVPFSRTGRSCRNRAVPVRVVRDALTTTLAGLCQEICQLVTTIFEPHCLAIELAGSISSGGRSRPRSSS
jgi:hypothetical protein